MRRLPSRVLCRCVHRRPEPLIIILYNGKAALGGSACEDAPAYINLDPG